MWVPKLGYLHPWFIKQYENCVRIAITFLNVFLLYMPVETCLPELFFIICGCTAENSFATIISSNVSLCSLTFCYARKLLNFSLPKDNQLKSRLIYHNKKTGFHIVQCVLWRFNWIPRDQDKLSYRFYWHKISLSIVNQFRVFFSCNLFILGYYPGIEQSRISLFQALNTWR